MEDQKTDLEAGFLAVQKDELGWYLAFSIAESIGFLLVATFQAACISRLLLTV
jgi:hypothetical protein